MLHATFIYNLNAVLESVSEEQVTYLKFPYSQQQQSQMAPNITSGGHRNLLFLYGTLKTGQPNEAKMHNAENGEAKLLFKAVTVERWPLVVATKHAIPFLLGRKDMGQVSFI